MPGNGGSGGSNCGGGERKTATPKVKPERVRVKKEEKEEDEGIATTEARNLLASRSAAVGARKRKPTAGVVSDEDDIARRELSENSVRRVRSRVSPPAAVAVVAQSDRQHETEVASDARDPKVKVESAVDKPGARNRGVKKAAAASTEAKAAATTTSDSGSDSDDRDADPDHVEPDGESERESEEGDEEEEEEEEQENGRKKKKKPHRKPRKQAPKKPGTAAAPKKARKPRQLRPGQKKNPGVHATTQAVDKRAKFRRDLVEYVKTYRAVLMNEEQMLNDPKAPVPTATLGPLVVVTKTDHDPPQETRVVPPAVRKSLAHPNWIVFYAAAVEALPSVLELVRESVDKKYDCNASVTFPKGAIQDLMWHLRHRGLAATPSVQNVNALTGRFKTTRIVPSKAQTVRCCLARNFNFAAWVNPDPDLVKKGVLEVRTFPTKTGDDADADEKRDADDADETHQDTSVKNEDDCGGDDDDRKYDGEAPLVDLNVARTAETQKRRVAPKKARTGRTPAIRRARAAPRKSSTKSGDASTDRDDGADLRFADESYRPVYADDVTTSEKFREFVMTLDSSCVDKFDAFWRSVTVAEYVHYRRQWPTLYPFMCSLTVFRSPHPPSLTALRRQHASAFSSFSSSSSSSSPSSSSSSSPVHSDSSDAVAVAAAAGPAFSLDRAPTCGPVRDPLMFMALMTSLTLAQLIAFDAFWRHSCLVQMRRFQKTWDDNYEGLRQAMIADEMRRLEAQLREKHRAVHPPRAPPPSDFAASWSTGHELAATGGGAFASTASQLSSLSSLGSRASAALSDVQLLQSLPSLPVAVLPPVAP